jgi:signal transduction histidine kinase
MNAHVLPTRASWAPKPQEFLLLLLAAAIDVVLFSDAAVQDLPTAGGPQTSPLLIVCYAGFFLALLSIRQRARFAVLLLICAGSVAVSLLTSYRPVIVVCVALASVIIHESSQRSIAAVVAAILTSTSWVYVEDRLHHGSFSWPVLLAIQLAYLVIVMLSAGIGWWRRTVERDHESRRAEVARTAIMNERRRVARELHDIVAHAVTLMVLQASGARAVMHSNPDRAQAALDVVERTGTEAMAELRRLLAILRTSPEDTSESSDKLILPPGLDSLPDLVESVRATGVNVTVHAEGHPRPLDKSVDAAAYRIVSESLTNVTKHSGSGATANVQIKWTDSQLEINIWDNGRGVGPDERLSTGNGLLGLTERIVLVGGAFQARPRDAGGYEVHATLPLPAGRSTLSTTSATP